jgi:glutamate-1-semialdehyde 2,1-aminomutase
MKDRWQKSRELLARAQGSLVGGVSSPFRAKFPVPLYLTEGVGSHVRDVDGNEYIDYTLAWGPLILGHRHPKIREAILALADQPILYGAEHETEYLVAEKIQQVVPCAERVAFTSSGSEAVQLAFRLARAFTDRNLIAKFEGHYHGWMDCELLSYHPGLAEVGPHESPHVVLGSCGQPANNLENVLVAPWNRIEVLEKMFRARGREIAAVIMEPVLCNSGCILPVPGYLEAVKNLCREHGALLIFDEVITGFRMALGGAQAYYGITPDLATFGKAVAAGAPLSAVAGRKEIMELYMTGGVAFGGTFNGNPISLRCSRVTLEELAREGNNFLEKVNQTGELLMRIIRDAAQGCRVPLVVCGFGGAFAVHFNPKPELIEYRDTLDDNREMLSTFLLGLLAEGIYVLPDGRFYISGAHSEQDIGKTGEAIGHVLRELR